MSTMESEYIAASDAVKELIWLLDELTDKNNDVKFLMDNQSAIRLIKNPEFHKRTKHIDVRYHFNNWRTYLQRLYLVRNSKHLKQRLELCKFFKIFFLESVT